MSSRSIARRIGYFALGGAVAATACGADSNNSTNTVDTDDPTTEEVAWDESPDDLAFLDGNRDAHLKFQIPRYTNPRDFALLASSGGIDLGEHVTLATRQAQQFARAATTGAGTLIVDEDSDTGSLTATGRVTLREKVHVHGDVVGASEILRHPTSVIDGTAKPNTPIATQEVDWKVNFPSRRRTKVRVYHQRRPVKLAPGYYSGLEVEAGATAVLTAGNYYFNELELNRRSVLRLDNSGGRISIFVKSKLELSGSMGAMQPERADVMLGYLNDRHVEVDGHFVGTLLAPRADIEVERPWSGTHDGAFIGRKIRVERGTRIVHTAGSAIIQSVDLDKNRICAGESLTVTVNAVNPYGTDAPRVIIDDQPGTRQVLQPNGIGSRVVSVVASASGFTESRLVSFEVINCATQPKPQLLAMGNTFHEGSVDVSIVNADSFMAPGTSYHWAFGDGTSVDTTVPAVTHSYIDAFDPNREHNSFDVHLTVHSAGLPDALATKTITLWNRYAHQKAKGTIVPYTRPVKQELKVAGTSVLANAAIQNVETTPLQIASQRIDLQPCDPMAAPIVGTTTPVNLVVPGRTTATADVTLPTSGLGGICSLAVYHFGTLGGAQPVVASTYFSLTRDSSPRVRLSNAASDILDYVADHGLVADPQSISDEELMQLNRERRIPSDLILHPHLHSPAPATVPSASSADPAKVGDPCVPGDTPPAGQNLVCTRVGWTQTDEAEIVNALRGDIVMSRACGPIGTLLSQVRPPQKWSHTGIMVQNYRTIAQSTAVFDYLLKNSAGSLFGNPAPFAGFFPHAMQYMFPGTITTSITEAYLTGKTIPGPDTHDGQPAYYTVFGFSHAATRCDGQTMVYPGVLKPPADRASLLRPTLHALADAANENVGGIHGHYRFGAYSDLASNNNPNPPPWVLQEANDRTMCSGLIWRAAKQIGLTLNTDKSDDINDTLPETPDGLFFYTEDERQAAGEALYRSIYNMVGTGFADGQEAAFQSLHGDIGGLAYLLYPFFNVAAGIEISSDVRNHAANQVTNCFASDNCGLPATFSEDWRHPGSGTSVSPDDLEAWDQYGLLEPLAFHSPRKLPFYTWQLGGDAGAACGTVRLNGQPFAGADVTLSAAQYSIPSQADGTFRFDGVPAGHFTLTATKTVGTNPGGETLSAMTDVDVVAGQVGPCVTLDLQRPDIDFRRLTISMGMFVHDEDDEENSTSGDEELLVSRMDPEKTWDGASVCAGGESRGNAYFKAQYLGSGAVLVTVDMQLHEGFCTLCDACKNNDLDGQLIRQVVVCDNSTSGQECAQIKNSLGLDPSAVSAIESYATEFPYLVKNTDETSGEFMRVGFELHNFRQR